jgi:tetratricopeptide (TPR) repeat protein
MLPREPQAEALVQRYLARPDAIPGVRFAYARILWQAGRAAPAVAELERCTREAADFAPAWLMLGALQLELKHLDEAERALKRYVEVAGAAERGPATASPTPAPAAAPTAAAPVSAAPATVPDDEDDSWAAHASSATGGVQPQAWLLLATVAEQRGDYAAAEAHLARVDNPARALEVQARRASIAARQGRIAEARQLIRQVPERAAGDARAKLVTEAQVMRDAKRWQEAFEVLEVATQRWPDDSDLLYELSMMAEKLNRLDEMERLLRRVIALRPDSQHAYNALGYSLADRGMRLEEARTLIRRALELAPGDPFITDSLGWVEFRLGNTAEALRLLRQAYAARPDTEIAAHLGEVLWATGQREEAVRVWREGRQRDAANDVLRETLSRLNPEL